MPMQDRPYADRVTRSQTIGALLDATVGADPARPVLTYYGSAADERVELSAVTLRNWVDKTANLLRDVLGADAASRISVGLPLHWQTVVWLLGCWRLGAVVVPEDTGPDVAVVGPAAIANDALPDSAEVVATSLHPLGAPFSTPLPLGVTDYGTEVFAQADAFTALAPLNVETPAWEGVGGPDDGALDHGGLLRLAAARAVELRLPAGGRLASAADPSRLSGVVEVVLVPLLIDGTVVLVRDAERAKLGELLASERVDVATIGERPGR